MLVYQRVIYILWIFHIYAGLLEANSDQMQRSTRWTIIRAFRWIRPRFYPVNPEDLIIQCVTTLFARSLCLFCSIYLLLCFCNSLCQTSKHPAIHFCGMVFNWADNISNINVHHPIGYHIYYTNPYISKWFMLILWYIMAVLQVHPPDYASPRNRVRSPDSARRVIPMVTRLGPAMLCTNSSWCCRDSSLRSPVMDDFLTLVLSKGSFCSTCLWSCSLYIIVCDLIYIIVCIYIYIHKLVRYLGSCSIS